MTQKININEGVFEIQYRSDFSDMTRYRKDYELFIIRFYPKNELAEESINDLFRINKTMLLESIDKIIEKHHEFFKHFRIERILHGDCCMKNYDSGLRKNVIACYMKKLKFVTIDRQKLPILRRETTKL